MRGASARGGLEAARWGAVASVVGLSAWALYVWTAAQGLSWFDSGELTAAAASIGISHPTGFPSWILMAKAASMIPVGTVGFRVALFGGACLVLSGLILGRLAGLVVPERTNLATVISTAGFVLSAAAWRHATATEVYGLHGLTVVGLLWGTVAFARAPSPRGLLALALAAGLSLGVHGELRGLGLVYLVMVVWSMRSRGLALWWLIPAAVVGVLGLSVYAMLPVRALAGPARLWADTSTLHGFLDHVTAARIMAAFSDQMWKLTGPVARFHAVSLAERTLADVRFLPLLAAAGLPALTPKGHGGRHIWVLVVAAVLLAADLAYGFLVNPMATLDGQNGLVTAAMVALLAGAGVAAASSRWSPTMLLVLSLVVMVDLGSGDLPDKDRSGLVAAGAMARDAVDVTAPHGLLLLTTDHQAAGVAYVRVVEGARPDLEVAVRQHLWVPVVLSRLRWMLAGEELAPAPPGQLAARVLVALVRAQIPLRQIRWEHGGGADDGPWIRHLIPGVPLWRLVASDLGPDLPMVDVDALLERLDVWLVGGRLGPGGRRVYSSILDQYGWHEAMAGRWERAAELFRAALAYYPRSKAALNNLGAVASRQGRMAEALTLAQAAARIDPSDPVTQLNIGRYALALRDLHTALEAFQTVLQVEPGSVDALSGLGATLANLGRYDEAEGAMRRALELDPDNQEARDNLQRLLRMRGR